MALPENRSRPTGIEGEVHQQMVKYRAQCGIAEPAQGILIPWHLRNKKFAAERRDLTTSTASGGIANILGTELIDILRNRMKMRDLGARVLSGLSGGTFSLPKQTAAAQAYHTAEAVAAAKSNLVLGQVTWTPRTLTAITAMTRKTLLQTSLDVEAVAREDLMKVMAIAFDYDGINGTGQDQQPMGILQNPDVPTVPIGANGGEMTWATVINLETQVATGNADFGALAYLTSPKGRGMLKTIPKISSSAYPIFIWEKGGNMSGEGEVNSYRAAATTPVPSNLTKGSGSSLTSLLFGNFESATYALWSGVDALVDPYSQGGAGSVLIYLFQDYDFQLRWEQSFAKCVDMATS